MDGGSFYLDADWDEDALASARVYVDGISARLGAGRIQVTGDGRVDASPADTIVAVSDEANTDLIVMSTDALTGPARALLGSVADAVVRTAHCPVLLMHRRVAMAGEQKRNHADRLAPA